MGNDDGLRLPTGVDSWPPKRHCGVVPTQTLSKLSYVPKDCRTARKLASDQHRRPQTPVPTRWDEGFVSLRDLVPATDDTIAVYLQDHGCLFNSSTRLSW